MIIESLLDTDLYKFTMMQVVLHHFPTAQVEYRFRCRTPGIDLTPYIAEIEREISGLCGLRFARRELDYLRSWRFFKSDFVDLLELFHLDDRFVSVAASSTVSGAGSRSCNRRMIPTRTIAWSSMIRMRVMVRVPGRCTQARAAA